MGAVDVGVVEVAAGGVYPPPPPPPPDIGVGGVGIGMGKGTPLTVWKAELCEIPTIASRPPVIWKFVDCWLAMAGAKLLSKFWKFALDWSTAKA